MPQSALPSHLAVFAKYWEVGQVKTRLAATIGPLAASRIYQAFFQTITIAYDGLADRQSLVVWPGNLDQAFQSVAGPNWAIAHQAPGDLGRKLDEFFQVQFAGTVQRVVAIGTDCPDLPVDFVSQAFELLRESPVVLGPATDGGYYLIGMNSFVPVFTDIDWSTDKVFAQTTRKLRQLSIRFATLPRWSDVDVNEDLRQLTDRLAKRTDLDAQHLLHRIDEILLAVRK